MRVRLQTGRRVLAALTLLGRFFASVLVSGLSTAAIVLRVASRRGPPPCPGFLRVPLAVRDARWATLEACLVGLTPGTTAVEVDMGRGQLVIHVLDLRDRARVLAALRRDIGEPIAMLAGGRRP